MKRYSGDAVMYFKFFDVEGETPAEAALHAIEQGEAMIWDTVVNGATEEVDDEEEGGEDERPNPLDDG